ncbi:MAG: LysM domain-containing protein [Chloroflexota bacterium]|nr:LysM peptidoglycan-binding domain-containing protein [Dehalococcoidia bacterium]MDW8254057.1 LysM domain-containing protein [Chloroflexota bacterium]
MDVSRGAMTTGKLVVIRCYRCGAPPDSQCPQCRRPFCKDHGNRLCLDCRRAGGNLELRIPLRGVPSSLLYRSAIGVLALLIALIAWDSWNWVARGGPNQARLIPTPTAAPPPATPTAAAAAPPTATPPAAERIHTVVEGDTLTSIARQYNVSIEAIVQLNNLGDRELIRLGQTLRIPPSR